MPSCPFVHRIHQSKGEKVPKSGAFKNEGIHESIFWYFYPCRTPIFWYFLVGEIRFVMRHCWNLVYPV